MRFGIISTAAIARNAVIPGIEKSDHTVQAIASRDHERARRVADDHDIPDAYGSYEALLDAPDIDAVYNPLPNSMHAEWSKRAADRGLDILCEKPLTANADQAVDLADYCRDRDVTLMEAFMYRYHPRNERAHELAQESLGYVHSVSGTFHYPLSDPDNFRLDPAYAGGCLMDLGCYPVSVARWVLGEPDRVFARARDAGEYGVDTRMMGLLVYDTGETAQFECSFDTDPVQQYRIEGTDGWVEAEQGVTFNPPTDDPTSLSYSIEGERGSEAFGPVNQYRLEVEHFADCVETGTTPRTGPEEAIQNMAVLDALYESAERDREVAVE